MAEPVGWILISQELNIGNAEDVAILGGAGADDFGEEGDTDPHDLAGLAGLEIGALGGLFGTKPRVADFLHALFHGRVVVAGIIFPAQRRLIGKLFALDEVPQTEFGGVQFELLGEDVHGAFDAIGGLGHPERAAVGNAARRLVGVDAIDRTIGHREVIGTGYDVEETGGPLGGIGAGIKSPVIGKNMHAKSGDFTVLGRGDFRRHMIIAGEAGGGRGSQCGPPPISPACR